MSSIAVKEPFVLNAATDERGATHIWAHNLLCATIEVAILVVPSTIVLADRVTFLASLV